MSFFLGLPAQDGDTISPQLEALGYRYYRAAPWSIQSVVTVSKIQSAYRCYTQFLPPFMRAHALQTKVFTAEFGHPVSWDQAIPMVTNSLPPVVFSFGNTLPPADVMRSLKESGVEEFSYKGESKVYRIANTTRDIVGILKRHKAIETTPCPDMSANLQCFGPLALIRKIFSRFFVTHYYPAFKSEDELFDTNGRFGDSAKGTGKRRKTGRVKVSRKRTAVSPNKPGEGPAVGTSQGIDMDVDLAEETEYEEETEVVQIAHPSPKDVTGWGSYNDIPAYPGIFLPYISVMANYDEEGVPRLINKRFLGCLGTFHDGITKVFHQVKSAWGIIAKTGAGKELSHIAKCVDIGLDAQALIFPVFDGEAYVGCALLGAGFRITAFGRSYQSVPHDELVKVAKTFGIRESIIEAIKKIVRDDDEENTSEFDSYKTWTAMGDLYEALKSVSISEGDRDEIEKLASRLVFPIQYFVTTPLNIALACGLIENPELSLKSIPLHASRLFNRDRFEVVWSSFGLIAPTCQFTSGPHFSLVPKSGSRGKKVDESTLYPPSVTFRLVPLGEATATMKRLIGEKRINMPPPKMGRSGPYKMKRFADDQSRLIIDAMRSLCDIDSGADFVVDSGVIGEIDLLDDF